jgi:ubiquinone/menaquinone biosynthesis C-methylase UbiE
MSTTTPNLFDEWAEIYDTEPNPLLQLEQRTLPSIMPPTKDLDVLDIGCGTGRWLKQFELLSPKSLTGTDASRAMLERASASLSPSTVLHLGDSTTVPVADASIDLVLASFVLSYLRDLDAFAEECVRILRPDGHILLSDMHPATAAQRNWIRSFRLDGNRIELPAKQLSVTAIITVFSSHGFELAILEEPAFDTPERPLFEQANKLDEYHALQAKPAIYLMKFLKVNALSKKNPLDFALFPNSGKDNLHLGNKEVCYRSAL